MIAAIAAAVAAAGLEAEAWAVVPDGSAVFEAEADEVFEETHL